MAGGGLRRASSKEGKPKVAKRHSERRIKGQRLLVGADRLVVAPHHVVSVPQVGEGLDAGFRRRCVALSHLLVQLACRSRFRPYWSQAAGSSLLGLRKARPHRATWALAKL